MAENECLNFPTEFPYEFDSNSPVESVVSSTESTDTFDDDDDFFAALTQRLAWSSLYETEKPSIPCFNPNIEKKCVKATSPQSTLNGIDSWFRPNEAGALIHHVAAREAACLKPYNGNGPFNQGITAGRSSIPVQSSNNGDYRLFSNQGFTQNLAFASQVQQVRQQELVLRALYASYWAKQAKLGFSAPQQKPEMRNRGRSFVYRSEPNGRCGLAQSAWLSLPPQPNGSPICPLPFNGSGVKRAASSGTGVFLPRKHVNPPEFRQKSGNPTIRYEREMKSPIQAPFGGCLVSGFDEILARRNSPLLPMQRSLLPEATIKQELHLPHEWSY